MNGGISLRDRILSRMTNDEFHRVVQSEACQLIFACLLTGAITPDDLREKLRVAPEFIVACASGKIQAPAIYWFTVIKMILPTSALGGMAALEAHKECVSAVVRLEAENPRIRDGIAAALGVDRRAVDSFIGGGAIVMKSTWDKIAEAARKQ
jgi:hypothetical protein